MQLIKIIIMIIGFFTLNACSDKPKNVADENTATIASTTAVSASSAMVTNLKSIDDSDTVLVGDLVWMRCTLGKVWENGTCNGRGKKYSWYNAANAKYPNSFRLPTKAELDSLVFCADGREAFTKIGDGGGCSADKHQKPTIDKELFPKTAKDYYWTATEVADDKNLAYGINFEFGFNLGFDKKDEAFVRLVRNK